MNEEKTIEALNNIADALRSVGLIVERMNALDERVGKLERYVSTRNGSFTKIGFWLDSLWFGLVKKGG